MIKIGKQEGSQVSQIFASPESVISLVPELALNPTAQNEHFQAELQWCHIFSCGGQGKGEKLGGQMWYSAVDMQQKHTHTHTHHLRESSKEDEPPIP